ncbi:MAG: peptidylprolyl isomerase [Clostridia bacterium]|nr:peptidylprolyl isomerase [Clostridia bacterium]
MKTSMGDIYIRLFPEAAPKAVENFTTHAKNGYYNGLTFHRVMEDFMIQGGDPKGDGTGGESVWGEDFEDEFDKKLLNIRGSLAMANSGVNTNGSQFFINQGDADAFAGRENYDYEKTHAQYANYYQQYCLYYAQQGQDFTKECPDLETFIELMGGISPDSRLVPDEVWDLYEKHGGSIHLDGAWRASGGHTVFGQVFKGMDVVDAIAAVETDDNDKPKEKVTINSIEVTTYAG